MGVLQSPVARRVAREIAAQLAVQGSLSARDARPEVTVKSSAPVASPRLDQMEEELYASLRRPLTTPSQTSEHTASPRRLQPMAKVPARALVVPQSAPHSYGADLLLKEAHPLDGDPLEASTLAGMYAGAGLSMAPPPASSLRS